VCSECNPRRWQRGCCRCSLDVVQLVDARAGHVCAELRHSGDAIASHVFDVAWCGEAEVRGASAG
jgi:hypothetical protein